MDSTTRPEPTLGSACQALISTVHQVAKNVTNFVRRCRSARTDLAPVTRELSELQMVLQLLDDFEGQRGAVPEELQLHLRPIITNCIGVVCKVQEVLQRQEVAGWTVEARDEVRELAKSLGVHRGVLGVVADLIPVLVSRQGSGKNGSNHDEGDHAQFRVLLEELQALSSSLVISYSNATLAREHFALQVHLGQIATYTETLARMEDSTSDPWQDAVRTLDEAEHLAGLEDSQATTTAMRGSIARPAPLGRGHSMDGNVAAAGVRNSGLENLLPLGPPEMYDGSRPPSMFFSPLKKVSDSKKPPAEIENAGPLGTGFIMMDGFVNSVQAAGTTMQSHGGGQQPSTQHPMIRESEPSSGRRSRSDNGRTPGELSGARLNAQRLQPIPPAVREGASGLEVLIPDEKELAVDEAVSDEALAFAQVPIHVLDRLSVNLVGQVYGGSPPSASPPENKSSTEGTQSQFTNRTSQEQAGEQEEEEEDTRDRIEAASYTSGDTSAHQNGRLENAVQIDVAKASASKASTTPMSHSHIDPQPLSQPQTPLGQQQHHHHQQHQLLPASHPLSQLPLNSLTSQTTTASSSSQTATDEITTAPIVAVSPRPSFQHSPLPSPQHLRSASNNSSFLSVNYNSGLREMTSSSTIKTANTQSYYMSTQKPLPRAPLVYIPDYPGPFIKKKVVVVGNFSCGKTCLLTRMSRGQYPGSKADEARITETIKVSVDESPVQLCFWDIRGIDYDPSWLHGAHVALVCFSVNIGSTDSKGKHLGRWVAEVNRNCPGAAILLVGLKSDIRFHAKSVEKLARKGKALVTPEQGEQFRENIGATRYVECSARTGEGVQDVLAETARVALRVGSNGAQHGRKSSSGNGTGGGGGVRRPLSRISKFFKFSIGVG